MEEESIFRQMATVIKTSNGDRKIPIVTSKGEAVWMDEEQQYSLSDDQTKLGRPEGFNIHVRDAFVNAGAGFVVILTGAIMTMPGLPKKPAAFGIDVDDNGKISLSIKQANVVKKSAKPAEIEWKQEKKKAQSGEKFEDIMSRFLKDSEERQQDFKKHQEFKGRSKKSF